MIQFTIIDMAEPTHLSSSSGLLELPSFALDVWLSALEWSTEVLDGLSVVPLSSEEDGVGSSGGSEGELVEGEGLTTGSDDPLSGRGGEFQSGNGNFGELWESLVVEDGSDNDNDLRVVWVRVLGLFDNSGEGDRGSVDLQQNV